MNVSWRVAYRRPCEITSTCCSPVSLPDRRRWWWPRSKPITTVDGITWITLKVVGTHTEGLLEVLADLATRALERPLLQWKAFPDRSASTSDPDAD